MSNTFEENARIDALDSPSVKQRVKTIEEKVLRSTKVPDMLENSENTDRRRPREEYPEVKEDLDGPALTGEVGKGNDDDDFDFDIYRYEDARSENVSVAENFAFQDLATKSWYDPTLAQKRINMNDPVPVRESKDFLETMHALRSHLDGLINQSVSISTPVLHHPEAFQACLDVNDVATLLDKAQCFRWIPQIQIGTQPLDLLDNVDLATKRVITLMGRAHNIRVGESASVRAVNIKTLTHATMGDLLACDEYIQYEGGEKFCKSSTLEVALRNVVRQILLVGDLFKSETEEYFPDGFVVESMSRDLLDIEDAEERPAKAWELAQKAGDIKVTARTKLFRHLNVWSTGITVTGQGFVRLRDSTGGSINIKVCLFCENTVERIAAGQPFVVLLSAVAENKPIRPLSSSTSEVRPETTEPWEEKGVHESGSLQESEDGVAEMFMRKSIPRLAVREGKRYASQVDIYSWGLNERGVLGIGSSENRAYVSPMSVPLYSVIELSRMSKISASLHHCVALSDMGLVYTWGSGADGALGHGDTEDCPYPRMVSNLCEREDPVLAVDVGAGGDLAGSHSVCVSKEGTVFSWGLGSALGLGNTRTRNSPSQIPESDFQGELIDAVACGGGFTLALGCTGRVFSWGIWQHGRLGLGKPEVRESARTFGRRRQKSDAGVQRFRVKPKEIKGALEGATIMEIACGDAHALAVDSNGAVYAWGRGSHGQLGIGDLRNSLEPVHVQHALSDENSEEPLPAIRHITCGPNHGAAISRSGQLFTWGDFGSPALGMGEALTNWSVRVKGSFVTGEGDVFTTAGQTVPVQREDPSWENASATKGTRDGQPWRWPRLVPHLADIKVRQISAGTHHTAAITTTGEIFVWGQPPCVETAEGVAHPRLAIDPLVRDAYVESFACGHYHTSVVTSGSRCAEALRRARDGGIPCDVEIIVEGVRLRAHRVILSARSPVVRRMIELEEEFRGDVEVIEIEWTDVSPDAAAVVLEYIYGDNLFETLDPMGTLAEEVCRVASDFELGRLEAICARSQATESDIMEKAIEKPEALASRFADDLSSVVNEPHWADVEIICADGKRIHAHNIILTANSLYFAERLRALRHELTSSDKRGVHEDGDEESNEEDSYEVLRLKMPESQSILLRLISFLYTGKLSDLSGNDGLLFEDLTAASTYGLDIMKHMCEGALVLNESNAVQALRLACELNCQNLRYRALHFVVKNLATLAQTKAFLKLQSERADINHDVLRLARAASQFRTIVTEKGLLTDETDPTELLRLVMRSDEEIRKEQKERDDAQRFDTEPIPWQNIGILLLCVSVYAYVMSTPEMLQYVPFANMLGLAGATVFIANNLAR